MVTVNNFGYLKASKNRCFTDEYKYRVKDLAHCLNFSRLNSLQFKLNKNNPFANFQLSSLSRPRIKAVINLKRRSPVQLIDGQFFQQNFSELRVSKSEKSLQTIFKPKSSKLKIKISSLPPISRSNTEDKQNLPTPSFKYFSTDRKKTGIINDKKKRNSRERYFDNVRKRNLIDISFNKKFKDFYND